MKKSYLNNAKLINIVKWWLIGMLLILPFHFTIVKTLQLWNKELSRLFNRLDEGTLFICLLIVVGMVYKYKHIIAVPNLVLLFSLVVLSACGFISGLINGNPFIITVQGIFHYIKYLLFIFVFAALFKDYSDFKKIFRLLLIVAVFIGCVAFIEEVWALYIRYVYGGDIYDNGVILFISDLLGISNVKLSSPLWRFGIYRSSLMLHYNLLGLYCLFILTFYLTTLKKVNYAVIFFLSCGILASVSRTAYAGFALLAGLQIIKGRRWFAVFFIPIMIALFVMFFSISIADFNVSKEIKQFIMEENNEQTEYTNVQSYRKYARQKAMEVWKDHPVWGVGPGMFGGAVAYKYRTPFYDEYNFHFALNWFHSVEQLWPQVLAEMGIAGAASMAGTFISLLTIFYSFRLRAASDEARGLFSGLSAFTLIFIIYTFSGNLNIISILIPFSAFAGMGIGSEMFYQKYADE